MIKIATIQDIERYSDSITIKRTSRLTRLARNVGLSWDRLWEYPFVAEEIFKYKKNIKILDCGGGFSAFSKHIKDQGYNITVIDVNKQSECMWFNDVNFIRMDMTDMRTILDNSYDIVVSISVIEHIRDWERAIDEMFRICRDKLIITTGLFTEKIRPFTPQTIKQLISYIKGKSPEIGDIDTDYEMTLADKYYKKYYPIGFIINKHE